MGQENLKKEQQLFYVTGWSISIQGMDCIKQNEKSNDWKVWKKSWTGILLHRIIGYAPVKNER